MHVYTHVHLCMFVCIPVCLYMCVQTCTNTHTSMEHASEEGSGPLPNNTTAPGRAAAATQPRPRSATFLTRKACRHMLPSDLEPIAGALSVLVGAEEPLPACSAHVTRHTRMQISSREMLVLWDSQPTGCSVQLLATRCARAGAPKFTLSWKLLGARRGASGGPAARIARVLRHPVAFEKSASASVRGIRVFLPEDNVRNKYMTVTDAPGFMCHTVLWIMASYECAFDVVISTPAQNMNIDRNVSPFLGQLFVKIRLSDENGACRCRESFWAVLNTSGRRGLSSFDETGFPATGDNLRSNPETLVLEPAWPVKNRVHLTLSASDDAYN
jgi:hypothetical protein